MSTRTHDERIMEQVLKAGRPTKVTFIDEPEPEPLFCPMISVDDHLLEPPTLFADRVPARLKDRAPHLATDDEGFEWWYFEDAKVPNLMLNGASGRVMSEWGMIGTRYDEMRRSVWDPVARLRDMDLTGVWASLCFPSTLVGFAGTRFAKMIDPDLGFACLQAYNDWMLEEWVGADPSRYIACQLPWLSDPDLAAVEIRRNAARGVRAVSFSENPEGLGFPNIYTTYWDPFLAACEETNTVVNLHVGSSGTTHEPCSSSPMAVLFALFPESGLEALMDWVFSRILVRFPGLQIVLSEAGVSWVPMAMERFTRAHRQRGSANDDWPADLPSPMEIVHRNFHFTSIEDPSAFRLLDLIGEDKVMVETDFPHYDSTWPNSQAMIRGQLRDLPPATIRKLCFENAAALYGRTPPPEDLIARSEVGAMRSTPAV